MLRSGDLEDNLRFSVEARWNLSLLVLVEQMDI